MLSWIEKTSRAYSVVVLRKVSVVIAKSRADEEESKPEVATGQIYGDNGDKFVTDNLMTRWIADDDWG